MKTQMKVLAILMVLAMVALPFALTSEDTDAYELKNPEIVRDFVDGNDGALAIYILNRTDADVTVDIKITSTDRTRTYAEKSFTIPANTTDQNVKDSDRHTEMSFSLGGSGYKEIYIIVNNDAPLTYGINVGHSIWNDWTTYVVIIIVIVFIVAIVWLRLRSVSDAKKDKGFSQEKVFTQMAEEKKAKKQVQAPQSSEPAKKKMYEGSKRKKQ